MYFTSALCYLYRPINPLKDLDQVSLVVSHVNIIYALCIGNSIAHPAGGGKVASATMDRNYLSLIINFVRVFFNFKN